ncbi:MAG: lipopolysaccharide kinase InaA family protein [Candidatus Bathyarchaeota archaeon]
MNEQIKNRENVDKLMEVSEELRGKIVYVCREVANSREIISLCIYGSQACGYARRDSDYDVLLVLRQFPAGVKYYYETLDHKQFAILTVNQKALELDAEKGDLGDFIAGRLLSPYIPIVNAEYLRKVEFITKRRFVEEDLEDLIIEYGELSRGLIISPEYLVLTRMEKRSRAYPPLRYSYINMLRPELRETNLKIILDMYRKVFDDLTTHKIIWFDEENITLVDNYVDKVLAYKMFNRAVNLMDFSKRAFYSYITHGKAGKVKLDVVAKELASKIKREIQTVRSRQELEDPKNYLFLKTEKGLVNLNKKDAIIEKLRTINVNRETEVKALSGALNEVYLVTIDNERLVVKEFTDWYNLKWFILNVAAYGTKTFHLSGKTRLTNEYVINQLLAKNKIAVPEIVAISIKDRVLIERYIKGKSFLDVMVGMIKSKNLSDEQRNRAFEVGNLLARIHDLEIVIGDCKAENFIAGDDGKVYVLDLEQGERLGDKAWDVAEFLYFSKYFGTTFTPGLQQFVRDFIEGYSSSGSTKVLREAAGLRYMRVFLTWTPISIMQGISSILKNRNP